MAVRRQYARTEVLGRVTVGPQAGRFGEDGLLVQRFTVSTELGSASPSGTFRIYVRQRRDTELSEDLAVRCGRLRKGDVVLVRGEQRHRMVRRRGRDVLDVSVLATDVRLRERDGA